MAYLHEKIPVWKYRTLYNERFGCNRGRFPGAGSDCYTVGYQFNPWPIGKCGLGKSMNIIHSWPHRAIDYFVLLLTLCYVTLTCEIVGLCVLLRSKNQRQIQFNWQTLNGKSDTHFRMNDDHCLMTIQTENFKCNKMLHKIPISLTCLLKYKYKIIYRKYTPV